MTPSVTGEYCYRGDGGRIIGYFSATAGLLVNFLAFLQCKTVSCYRQIRVGNDATDFLCINRLQLLTECISRNSVA